MSLSVTHVDQHKQVYLRAGAMYAGTNRGTETIYVAWKSP
jgi:hypothetical protein